MTRLPLSVDARGETSGRVLVLVGVGAALLIALGGLTATLLFTQLSPGLTGAPGLATDGSSPSASPLPSGDPAGGVLGSRRLVANFDTALTGSDVVGWGLTDAARLTTELEPSAVDRSARLTGGTACHELDVDIAQLDVTFMLEQVPDGEVGAMTLELRDGTSYRLTIRDGQVTAAAGAEPGALEAGRWYLWRLAIGDEDVRAEVLAADGTTVSHGTADLAADARATDFCMTATSSVGLFLSDLAVGTR